MNHSFLDPHSPTCSPRVKTSLRRKPSLTALLAPLALVPLLLGGCSQSSEPGSQTSSSDDFRLPSEATAAGTPAMSQSDVNFTLPEQLAVAEKPPYGAYLTDSKGQALYMFDADQAGTSNCTQECLEEWQPLTSNTGVESASQALDSSKLGTLDRPDGGTQVSYAGHPLYYYIEDTSGKDTRGQSKQDSGGTWYLVAPDGDRVSAQDSQSAPQGQSLPSTPPTNSP